MMEFAKSLKILSLAGALLLAAPVIANARGGEGGGHSGGGGGFGHSPGGHGHGHRGWDGDDDFTTDFWSPDDYAYGGSCAYYSQRWHQSGSPLWLRRYEACMRG